VGPDVGVGEGGGSESPDPVSTWIDEEIERLGTRFVQGIEKKLEALADRLIGRRA
jgi:hypothetical protein